MSQAEYDVIAELHRQKAVEGWTAEHDDTHTRGEMAQAAACYAEPSLGFTTRKDGGRVPTGWPLGWASKWWKPKDRRRDLVRAGALILAEIERLDRATPSPRPCDGADGTEDKR